MGIFADAFNQGLNKAKQQKDAEETRRQESIDKERTQIERGREWLKSTLLPTLEEANRELSVPKVKFKVHFHDHSQNPRVDFELHSSREPGPQYTVQLVQNGDLRVYKQKDDYSVLGKPEKCDRKVADGLLQKILAEYGDELGSA